MRQREGSLQSHARHGVPEVAIYVAQLLKLADLEVLGALDGLQRSGPVILVRASSSMLSLSRQQGGLRHRFGALEGEEAAFGTLYIHGEDELHVLIFDLNDPEVYALVSDAGRNGGLKVLMVDESRSMRLMVTHGEDDFRVLKDAAKAGRTADAAAFAMNLGEAMRFATSDDVLHQLGVIRTSLTTIQVSCVVTPLRVAEVERLILGGVTH